MRKLVRLVRYNRNLMRRTVLVTWYAVCFLSVGCSSPSVWRPSLIDANSPPPRQSTAPYLKAHLHSGELVVLTSWNDEIGTDRTLRGTGIRYDPNRVKIAQGSMELHVDAIALLESNHQETVARLGYVGLSVYTVLTGTVTLICLIDPKGCFGSCPTFYLDDKANRPVAEGFSSSFARVFEETDIDALRVTAESGGNVSLLMMNEALATHAVRSLRLRAVDAVGH